MDENKKYISLSKLATFLDNLKINFATLTHKHSLSDIADFTIDSELSSTSINPIQNKVVNAEFDAISDALLIFENELDNKLYSSDYIIDNQLSSSSANPVQNQVISNEIASVRNELNSNLETSKNYTDTKISDLINSAPETLDTLGELATAFQENEEVVQVLNDAITTKADADAVLYKTPQELTPDEVNQVHKNLKLDNLASEEQVEALYKNLTSNRALRFYCIEDVTIVLNGVSTTYPANSNVEVKFVETDEFEIIPTSDNSILALNAFPGALGTYYSWLEGVKQFSNILFDMNPEDMYSKWSQGNQGSYQVQYAQYLNCIFWSDNPYISDVAKRTNYTLYYTSQLPLCYSTIPDNTFKAFYLAFSVNSDPNWGNKAYRDSFAKATWATQVFSYYGARTIGIFGHDHSDFNIVLPKDCRGLMYAATAIENAGTFDAVNTTNFGASSGSWRDAFGWCSSLRNLYIKNLKVNLNVSWSPLNYDSIYFIISEAKNTNKITITVSPYTYNLLGQSDFELAESKNITIALLTTNYVEDRRLSTIANKADKELVNAHIDNADVHITSEEREKWNNDYYPKTEMDALLADKATAESPIFGGSLGLNPNGELGFAAVSLGYYNKASGMYSFAEGMGTNASGDSAHAEGTGTNATGYGAHAEGAGSIASGIASHAEGVDVESQGWGSHAEGQGVVASADGQHAQGRYNIIDTEKKYSHIVGNGTSNTERSNAHTIDWEGNAEFSGDIKAYGCGGQSSISLKNISERTTSLEMIIDEIQDITSEEIQALFI